MTVLHHVLYLTAAGALFASGRIPALTAPPVERVRPNDNTRAAGTTDGDVVTVRLRAAVGRWRPEGEAGPALRVEAFGEEGQPLAVPAPLLRVVEGSTLVVSVRNALTSPLRVHGLCARDGAACAPVDVPPGADREVRFASGRPGTYHYWATSMGAPVPFRELAGAFVVDPAGVAVDPDRIFVITEWSDLTAVQLRQIMAADHSQTHPMHLHGFYYTVQRLGDGLSDQVVGGAEGRRVVTQMLPAGGTLTMAWVPEGAGNWLFHCDVMHHVAPERRLGASASGDAAAARVAGAYAGHSAPGVHDPDDPSLGMAGMVLGITARIDVSEGGTPMAPAKRGTAPGPPVVLRRGEPVAITLVNRLGESTSMHNGKWQARGRVLVR